MSEDEIKESYETYLKVWEILKPKKIGIIVEISGLLIAQMVSEALKEGINSEIIMEKINHIIDSFLKIQEKNRGINE